METTKRNTLEKKAFDPTVCFTFFGNWVEAIENLEDEADRNSRAYMLFKALANYSMYHVEPDFDESPATIAFRPFWPMLTDQVENSIKNRKHGFGEEELTEKQQIIIETIAYNPTASIREVAETTGASKSAVGRVSKRFADKIKELSAAAAADAGTSDSFLNGGIDTHTASGTGNDNAGVSDSTGTGQRDRQFSRNRGHLYREVITDIDEETGLADTKWVLDDGHSRGLDEEDLDELENFPF